MLANLDKLNAVSQAEESKTPPAPMTPGLLGPTGIDTPEPEEGQNEDDVPMSELERMENEGMYSALSEDGAEEEEGAVQVHNQADGAVPVLGGIADVPHSAGSEELTGSDVEARAGAEASTHRDGDRGVEEEVGEGNEDGESRRPVEGSIPPNNPSYTDAEHGNQGDAPEFWDGEAPPGTGTSDRRSHHNQGDGEGARERGRRHARQDRRVPAGQRAFDNVRYRANDDSGSEENNTQDREGGIAYGGNEDFDADYDGEEEEYEFDSADDDEEDEEEDEEDEDEEDDDGEGDDDSDNEGGDAEDRGIDVPTDEDREVKLITSHNMSLHYITSRYVTLRHMT